MGESGEAILDSEDYSLRSRELYEADQRDRELDFNDPQVLKGINERDSARREEALSILSSHPPTDGESLHYLSFIFQHGTSSEDYARALELATLAVEAGFPPEYSLYAQATDRLILQRQFDLGIPLENLKQKFGTQNYHGVVPPLDGTATEEEIVKYGVEKVRQKGLPG